MANLAHSMILLTLALQVGLQDDRQTWAFGPDMILDENGMTKTDSKYVWIGHLYSGPFTAAHNTACSIDLPLRPLAIVPLVDQLEVVMGHNFFPALLVLGATALATHYSTILERFLCCPVPLVFGDPGTGKTTALRCGLSFLGSQGKRLFSKATKEKYSSLCSSSTLPLVIDDPQSQSVIGDLVMSLYNGAFEGTISRGQEEPSAMALIGANFTTSQDEQ